MRMVLRLSLGLLLIIGHIACDSMDLMIDVRSPEDGWLEVANANDSAWKDARLVVEVVESEGTTRPCDEKRLARWEPDEAIRVLSCGEKLRLILTTGGETARFSYFNDQLYRQIGRKEVPINR
ncbi:MAG: hypothetical protein P8127_01450 [Acidobacteriota bacterium]